LYYCVEMDTQHSFLAADLSISCTTTTYFVHTWVGVLLIALVVLGIPLSLGHRVWKVRAAIRAHKGPAYLETLYDSYKPENPLWEIYQMLQKVVLIGLLSFIERGSILQSLIGLVVSNLVLIAFVRQQPYLKYQTNILSITGQAVIVLSYLSAVLLRIDLGTEAFTVDTIGGVIIAANVPMGVYLVYDTFATMRDEISKAQIDLLTSELGGAGATYLCVKNVEITAKLRYNNRSKNLKGQVKEGDEIVAIQQAFDSKNDARLWIEGGWVSFSSGGLLGTRYFVLLESAKPEKTGKLRFKIERRGARLIATIMSARGLQNKDLLGKNDVYVVVYVDGERKQTTTLDNAGANASWNGKHGEALEFDIDGSVDTVELECWDADENDDDDLIGVCEFPVKEFEAAGDTWGPWEGARILHRRRAGLATESETVNPIADVGSATLAFEVADEVAKGEMLTRSSEGGDAVGGVPTGDGGGALGEGEADAENV
jgi:hypothetical protein